MGKKSKRRQNKVPKVGRRKEQQQQQREEAATTKILFGDEEMLFKMIEQFPDMEFVLKEYEPGDDDDDDEEVDCTNRIDGKTVDPREPIFFKKMRFRDGKSYHVFMLAKEEFFVRLEEETEMKIAEEKNAVAADLLGLDPDAEIDDINRTFRKLSLKFHPDKYKAKNHPISDGCKAMMTKAEVEEKFKELSDARDEMLLYRERLSGDEEEELTAFV